MSKIKDLPQDLRPREKMLLNGTSFLANYELLAIILGTGTRNQDVGEISEKIFPSYTNQILFNNIKPELLSKKLGIPIIHACKLSAFFELGKRYYKSSEECYIHSPEDVFKRFKYLSTHKKEHLIGIYLDTRNKIIHEEIISIGTVNASLISAKETLEPAIIKNAVSIVICHNHPSGNPVPSFEDISSTETIKKACEILGIRLLDHVIIGNKKYFSIVHKERFTSK